VGGDEDGTTTLGDGGPQPSDAPTTVVVVVAIVVLVVAVVAVLLGDAWSADGELPPIGWLLWVQPANAQQTAALANTAWPFTTMGGIVQFHVRAVVSVHMPIALGTMPA
jgi:hypothetical protein